MLVLHTTALCLHHVVYREIRKSEQTQPKGLPGEEQALRRWSVIKASWGWGICMLVITSPHLQCHLGTLTGHGRAHPSQGRFSSSSASQSLRQVKAQQSTSWSVLVEAGMDGADQGEPFPSDPQCCHFSLTLHPLPITSPLPRAVTTFP